MIYAALERKFIIFYEKKFKMKKLRWDNTQKILKIRNFDEKIAKFHQSFGHGFHIFILGV